MHGVAVDSRRRIRSRRRRNTARLVCQRRRHARSRPRTTARRARGAVSTAAVSASELQRRTGNRRSPASFDSTRSRKRALLHRRERLSNPAGRRGAPANARRSQAARSDLRAPALPDHDAGRRHVAGRPGHRRRADRRHLEVPQRHPRTERRRNDGRAWSRASCSTS